MRKTLILLTVLNLAGPWPPALGQTTQPPRQPIFFSGIPEPIPDPSGVYLGTVIGHVRGFETGEFLLGDWRFVIRSRRCSECLYNQFILSVDSYRGMTYVRPNGTFVSETGFGSAVMNPDSGIVDFKLFADNCSSIAGGLRAPGIPPGFPGSYFAGRDSEVPGEQLKIRQNRSRIAGRISGRDCYNQIVNTDVTLFKQ